MSDSEPSTYDRLEPARLAVIGGVSVGAEAIGYPIAGALLAAVDAQIEQMARSKHNSAAWAIAEALQKGIGLRTYNNMRTLAARLIDAEGYLPQEIAQSDSFMRSLAVCTELSAQAEDTRKVLYLFNLLIRGVIDEQARNPELKYEFYAKIISELSITELHMLARQVEFEQQNGDWEEFIAALSKELEINQEDMIYHLESMSRTPVYQVVYRATYGGGTAERKVTPIGHRLIDYIKDENWHRLIPPQPNAGPTPKA